MKVLAIFLAGVLPAFALAAPVCREHSGNANDSSSSVITATTTISVHDCLRFATNSSTGPTTNANPSTTSKPGRVPVVSPNRLARYISFPKRATPGPTCPEPETDVCDGCYDSTDEEESPDTDQDDSDDGTTTSKRTNVELDRRGSTGRS